MLSSACCELIASSRLYFSGLSWRPGGCSSPQSSPLDPPLVARAYTEKRACNSLSIPYVLEAGYTLRWHIFAYINFCYFRKTGLLYLGFIFFALHGLPLPSTLLEPYCCWELVLLCCNRASCLVPADKKDLDFTLCSQRLHVGVFVGSSINTKSDDSENRASCMSSSLYTSLAALWRFTVEIATKPKQSMYQKTWQNASCLPSGWSAFIMPRGVAATRDTV